MYIPDNYDAYDAYEREQSAKEKERIESLPVCDWCGETINDDSYYDINGDIVCPDCIDDCRRSTEYYVE